MSKIVTLYTTSVFLLLVGIWLVRNGLQKEDFKSKMKSVNYRPIRNYGKGYSVIIGIVCLILGILLLVI
jgi:uncharacterized membrane protein HdeD (DUF308 family)